MPSRTSVVATVRIEGFHRWPEAPDWVDFLRVRHRHLFTIKVWLEVHHDNRDTEFIILGRSVLDSVRERYGRPMELGFMSCEMLARELVGVFQLSKCEVWEDDENGAVVEA